MPDEPSAESRPQMIPVLGEGVEIFEIHDFAMTYDGYTSNGDSVTGFHNCATLANLAAQKRLEHGLLRDALHDLRTCLLIGARRHRWDTLIAVDYEVALIRRIREISGGEVFIDPNSPSAIRRRRP